jgi:hypothetical protein
MTKIPESLREQIRQRAGGRCEYCGIPEEAQLYPFHVEHIIALKHGGATLLDNLAWSCFDCNVAKGTDLASYDEETGSLTPLYHPRQQSWSENFELRDGQIVGTTPVGRVTARLLKLNLGGRTADRQILLEAGLWEAPT